MRNDGETALGRHGPTADGMRLGLHRHAELARDRIARDDGESALRRFVPSHGGRRQECEQERENKLVIHGTHTGLATEQRDIAYRAWGRTTIGGSPCRVRDKRPIGPICNISALPPIADMRATSICDAVGHKSSYPFLHAAQLRYP